jgi:hypothetical protein
MESCSYSSRAVQCREEPLEIVPGEGTAAIEPASFGLCPSRMKLHNVGEPTGAAPLSQQNPVPAQHETQLPQSETQPGQRYSLNRFKNVSRVLWAIRNRWHTGRRPTWSLRRRRREVACRKIPDR